MPPPTTQDVNTWFHDNDSDRVVVFLHGLLSDSRACWLSEDSSDHKCVYWPDLVLGDSRLGAPSIFMAGYYTSAWARDYGVRQCAAEVLRAIRAVRLGARSVLERRQIILVCHSTGGVVARYLLAEHYQLFADKTVFLLLLGSPSVGSRMANLFAGIATLVGNKLAKELRAVSPELEDLDGRFQTLIHEGRIPGLSGVELFEHPAFPTPRIVSKESAGRYFGEPIQAAGETHSTMAKPTSRNHVSHRALVEGVARLQPLATGARWTHERGSGDWRYSWADRHDSLQ